VEPCLNDIILADDFLSYFACSYIFELDLFKYCAWTNFRRCNYYFTPIYFVEIKWSFRTKYWSSI